MKKILFCVSIVCFADASNTSGTACTSDVKTEHKEFVYHFLKSLETAHNTNYHDACYASDVSDVKIEHKEFVYNFLESLGVGHDTNVKLLLKDADYVKKIRQDLLAKRFSYMRFFDAVQKSDIKDLQELFPRYEYMIVKKKQCNHKKKLRKYSTGLPRLGKVSKKTVNTIDSVLPKIQKIKQLQNENLAEPVGLDDFETCYNDYVDDYINKLIVITSDKKLVLNSSLS